MAGATGAAGRAEGPGADGPAVPAVTERSGRSLGRLHPTTAMLMVSLLALVLLLAASSVLPVPYAVMSPGPATNTLGEQQGTPLIAVKGATTYPTSGGLDLTTVRIYGGEGRRVTLWQVVSGWLSPEVTVVREEAMFPPGQTAEETKEQNQQLMASSQESATAAALTALGYSVPRHMQVLSFAEDSPSRGVLAEGDQVISVGGTPVGGGDALRAELQKVTPGEKARLVVRRAGREVSLDVPTTTGSTGATVMGVIVKPAFTFPFDVTIQIENVGGPSAGTMFALGIIDKLTPGSMTDGRTVAGTGTITEDGVVGPIGGIRQKMVGAREAGASVFLAPADNCPDVVGYVPEGLSVIRMATLAEARAALEEVRSGGPDSTRLPRCS